MKWTNDDISMVEKFIEIRNRGFYADSKQLNDVYNRVLEKNVAPTSCGSCMRARITELETALNQYKHKMELSSPSESVKESEQTTIKAEENKASDEPKKAVKVRKKKEG